MACRVPLTMGSYRAPHKSGMRVVFCVQGSFHASRVFEYRGLEPARDLQGSLGLVGFRV